MREDSRLRGTGFEPVAAPAAKAPRAGSPCHRNAAVAIGLFLLLWLVTAVNSRGFFAADGYTHYLYARFAFSYPANVVDVWARPICTLFYCLPAHFAGRIGVYALSVLAAIGCGVIACRLARQQGDERPELALICTLAQPLLFLFTLTAMTELPFALLLGWMVLVVDRELEGVGVRANLPTTPSRPILIAALCSLLPLARPEGFGFLVLVALWLLIRRQLLPLLILPLPLLAWDLVGWRLTGSRGPWWQWLPSQWPYSAHSMYGHGHPLAMVATLPSVVSPLLMPAMLIGAWLSLRSRRRGLILVAVVPLGLLCGHSLLYAAGRLGSYGEARYLLIASPLWGVLAARGWSAVFDRLRWHYPVRWAAAACCAPILFNLVHPVVPLRPDASERVAQRVADWYQRRSVRPRLFCADPVVLYELDLCPSDRRTLLPWDRQTLLNPPAGAVLVFDPNYCARNASSDRAVTESELMAAGWREETTAEADALGNATATGWRLLTWAPQR